MSSEQEPQVSVVLPTHNRPDLLDEAVHSVRAQTLKDWELIVVDDASQPPAKIAADDSRVRLVRHDVAMGGAAAKNTGIQVSRGRVLAFLDDDDLYEPLYLQRGVAALDRNKQIDVVFMGVSWFGTNADWAQRNYSDAMARFLASAGGEADETLTIFDDRVVPALLRSVPMAMQRPIVKRAALSRIGEYRADCLLWDCDWAIRASLNAHVALLSEGLYRQRSSMQGYSSQGTRLEEQLNSNIQIKDRLLELGEKGICPEYLPAFKRAAADAWFDLAWHRYLRGRRLRAASALAHSARRQSGKRHISMIVRLLLPCNASDNS